MCVGVCSLLGYYNHSCKMKHSQLNNSSFFVTLAINVTDGHNSINNSRCEFLPKKEMGMALAIKPYSIHVKILCHMVYTIKLQRFCNLLYIVH